MRERFLFASGLGVAALALLGACANDPAPTPSGDASSDRGSAGRGAGGSGGSATDAGGDATSPPTDGPYDDVAPCVIDPDATVNCPPQDLPPDDNCPDAAPSYAKEVAAIIARKCTVCHQPGGVEPVNQFDTLAKILKNQNNIHMLTQVYSCRMPQACGAPLTPDEKQKLLQWLVCGAPNN